MPNTEGPTITAGYYIIRGGSAGRERLRLLSRVMHSATCGLLDRVGVRPGMSYLDMGCGGGDVTVELARRAGPTSLVVGEDIDAIKLSLAEQESKARAAQSHRGTGCAVHRDRLPATGAGPRAPDELITARSLHAIDAHVGASDAHGILRRPGACGIVFGRDQAMPWIKRSRDRRAPGLRRGQPDPERGLRALPGQGLGPQPRGHRLHDARGPGLSWSARARYLMPITIESGPTSASVRVEENPASFIQRAQSAPV